MSRARLVTHAYRYPEGWQEVKRERLTREYARELIAQGFTLIRARRGFFDVREVSLSWYVA
ncbi:predicted alternative tryptophan synthase beta-subunit [Microbacterium testaceum StLB037]|uniref:Predicted alternative tryptophan synthase beta-subunit n=1 Tax=Microbacterium testaceum (strain StLB037) TaxID=979556 RepID=E8N8Q2_MICTS|nr:hypothetical protein [Microbacterium testaceum]BAJ75708.1 predicted alternative tryptophan synthase beta-subunit [Microbacterium testaceum StLB037]